MPSDPTGGVPPGAAVRRSLLLALLAVPLAAPASVVAVPGWSLEGVQPKSKELWTVASGGDLDGDGHDELLVGIPHFDGRYEDDGQVQLFHGGPTGPAALPDRVFSGDTVDAKLGTSVAFVGDVDGDGYDDMAMSAPYTSVDGELHGRVVVYHGSPTGLSATEDWQATSAHPAEGFGASVAPAGDVNADGFDDLIVGAYLHDVGDVWSAGRAALFLGSPTGLAAEQAWEVLGTRKWGELGREVAGIGDVDGDGYDDVAIGAPNEEDGEAVEGLVYVFRGTPAGLEPTASWILQGDAAAADFGDSIADRGDTNGDGYADLLVGAPGHTGAYFMEGAVYAWLGSPAGLAAAPSWVKVGPASGGLLGDDVQWGDTNADGYDDVVTGAATEDVSVNFLLLGRLHLYHGGPGGPSATPDQQIWGEDVSNRFTATLATGDVDGDGLADVVATAPWWWSGLETLGKAYVFLGSCPDDDGDGSACEDCSDLDAGVHPGADERCNAVDDDCDGAVDELPVDMRSWYGDADGDGYADPRVVTVACEPPPGYVPATDPDCDDAAPGVHPGAEDVPGDGVDQDCDGSDAVTPDTDLPADTDAPDASPRDPAGGDKGGCSSTGGPAGAWWLALAALGLRRRR